MNIILVGGRGFLGEAVKKKIQELGHTCLSAGRSFENDLKFNVLSPLSTSTQLAEYSPDLVINLAGAFENEMNSNLEVNSLGPKNLIAALENIVSAPKLIHISSATEPRNINEAGHFESAYSQSKFEGSRAVLSAITQGRIEGKILRVHNCYGRKQPTNRFVAWAVEKLSQGVEIDLLHPHRVRDFCLVQEAAECIARIVNDQYFRQGETCMEVGSGIGNSLVGIAHEICDLFNVPRSLVRTPKFVGADAHAIAIANVNENSPGYCPTKFADGIKDSYGEHK